MLKQILSTLMAVLILQPEIDCAVEFGDGSIYVGTIALCGTCTTAANSGCTTKCITFRDNTGNKNLAS